MILGAKNKYNIPEINIISSEYINHRQVFDRVQLTILTSHIELFEIGAKYYIS
jgi:hypothetical protein